LEAPDRSSGLMLTFRDQNLRILPSSRPQAANMVATLSSKRNLKRSFMMLRTLFQVPLNIKTALSLRRRKRRLRNKTRQRVRSFPFLRTPK